jgi:hypothetical protein
MHHQDCAFSHAHRGFPADQFVVEPEGVSWLQAGVLQRIFHTFQGDAGGRPIRSAASRMCGTAKRAPNLPPMAQRRSAVVAPRSLAASTASWPSILSFLAGWRSRDAPSLSTSSARSSPNESISPTTRSGTTPASSAKRAPPSAATTRSARSATRLSRPAESAEPFRKIATRTLRGLRAPVVQLSWRRLRSF